MLILMKKILLALLLCLICSACSKDTRSYEDKQSNKLTNLFTKKMKPLGLHAIGIGGAMREDKVTSFEVTFIKDEVVSKDQARRWIVKVTQEYLEYLNAVEENYYFAKVPVDLSMVRVGIIFKSPEKGELYLSSVTAMNDMIYYHYNNETVRVKKFPSDEETFEEAVRIIHAENDPSNPSCRKF